MKAESHMGSIGESYATTNPDEISSKRHQELSPLKIKRRRKIDSDRTSLIRFEVQSNSKRNQDLTGQEADSNSKSNRGKQLPKFNQMVKGSQGSLSMTFYDYQGPKQKPSVPHQEQGSYDMLQQKSVQEQLSRSDFKHFHQKHRSVDRSSMHDSFFQHVKEKRYQLFTHTSQASIQNNRAQYLGQRQTTDDPWHLKSEPSEYKSIPQTKTNQAARNLIQSKASDSYTMSAMLLDLSGVSKNIDNEELRLEQTRNNYHHQSSQQNEVTLVQAGIDECFQEIAFATQRHEIYTNAIDDVSKRITATQPQGKNLKKVLQRLNSGFNDSITELENSCKSLVQQKDLRIVDLENSIAQLEQEFIVYKEGNDLNRLLCKGMDEEAARKVLKAIAEILEETTWHQYSRELVDQQEGQGFDIKRELDVIMGQYDRHHKLACEQAMQNNTTYYDANKEAIKKDKPMDTLSFNYYLKEANNNQLKKTVGLTKDSTVDCIERLRKTLKNEEVQTLSMEELFEHLSKEIKETQRELARRTTQVTEAQQRNKALIREKIDQERDLAECRQQLQRETETLQTTLRRQKTAQSENQNLSKEVSALNYNKQKQDNELNIAKEYSHKQNQQIEKLAGQMRKLFKQNELLQKKVVTLGGAGALQDLLEECSTSETEEEAVTRIANSDRRTPRMPQNTSAQGDTSGRQASQATAQSQRSGTKDAMRDIDTLSRGKSRGGQHDTSFETNGKSPYPNQQLSRQQSEAAYNKNPYDDSRSVAQKNKGARQSYIQNQESSEGTSSNFHDQNNYVKNDYQVTVSKQQSKGGVAQRQKSNQNLKTQNSDLNIEKKVKFDEQNIKKQKSSKSPDRGHDKPAKKTKDKDIDQDTFELNLQKKNPAQDQTLKVNQDNDKSSSGKSKRDKKKTSVTTLQDEGQSESDQSTQVSDQHSQTDLIPLIEMACDMFLNQLALMDFEELEILRIKEIVERIKARCRQNGVTLLNLVGVEYKCPHHQGISKFNDMHDNAHRQTQKSHHFSLQKPVPVAPSAAKQKQKAQDAQVGDKVGHFRQQLNQ